MIQQCWYFTPSERPDFVALLNTLNDIRDFPSQHIILNTSGHTYALGIPSQASHHGRRHPEQQQQQRHQPRDSPTSSRANETVHTMKTVETTVTMQSDEEEEVEGEEEEGGEEEEEEEEEREGEEGSLGPPTLKKSRTAPRSAGSATKVTGKKQPSVKMTVGEDSSSREEDASLSVMSAQDERSDAVTSGSESDDTPAYGKVYKHGKKNDFVISPMYAELISKLASSDSSYP